MSGVADRRLDERFTIEGDPVTALRGLLGASDGINAEQLAEKRGVQGLALRNLLRCQRSSEFPRCDHGNSPGWAGWLRLARSWLMRARWPRMR
jgi:hypothetical protein